MNPEADIEDDDTRPAAIDRLVFMEAVLNMLAGSRCDKRQIVTRVVALLFVRKHFLLSGMTMRQTAKRFGISHAALSRGRRTILPTVAAMVEKARIAFDARFAKAPRLQRENRDQRGRTAQGYEQD